MAKSPTNVSSGISFFGLLTILFIGLRLTNTIDWAWWIVLLPLYAPIAIALSVIFVLSMIHLLLNER